MAQPEVSLRSLCCRVKKYRSGVFAAAPLVFDAGFARAGGAAGNQAWFCRWWDRFGLALFCRISRSGFGGLVLTLFEFFHRKRIIGRHRLPDHDLGRMEVFGVEAAKFLE